MAWKSAIDNLLQEFIKINLMNGSFEAPIDVKYVESKLRILTSEPDRSLIEKEHLISIFPAIFLCLSSNDSTLRQSVARFLPSLKDLLDATSCNFSDWKGSMNLEFIKVCEERLILIVEESSDDWIEPWLLLVNILFTDDKDESNADIALLNRLLSVIEKAFKAAKVKTEKFKTVFQTWERFCTFLTDSLSYKKFLTTVKRLKLLVLPFLSIKHVDADPYKLRAWFHVVEKIGLHSEITVDEIVRPFLHFLIENRRIFVNYKENVSSYLKLLSQLSLVITKNSSEFLKCLELAIEHDCTQEDIIASWSFLCGHLLKMDFEYFKSLSHFLKIVSSLEVKKELTVELCLIAYKHKLFDFKSVYLEEVRATCNDVFLQVITSPSFRENVFLKILVEMLNMSDNLETEDDVDEEGCMSPILSIWEVMVTVYYDFVDSCLDSRFNPSSVDVAIIKDIMILPLSQPLQESSQEKSSVGMLLSSFIKCLAKKIKGDLFSHDFLQKLGNGIQTSRISLDNSLWLASTASELGREFNLIPLLTVISKSIASCGQPKAVLLFLNILDKATEKSGLKMNFKATLNYLKKFSSAYEPPYDQQIRLQAHSLLKRLPENLDNKSSPINSSEPEEKKSNIRTATFHSNFLSRLSKAEEKKNSKNVLAASIFPRNSDEAETNKENKQKTNEAHTSPTSYRFAKSSAFILDNSESSEPLQNDNFEAKVVNFKVSTDFHKNVSPAKVVVNRVEAGLSPNAGLSNKLKPNVTDSSPKTQPVKDAALDSERKSPKSKFNFLDNNSLDTQDFVFVPPKVKESPLTKHQKEMMNKRREEIPALYQDLSQDTQNTSEILACELSSLENNSDAFDQNEDAQTFQPLTNDQKEVNITRVNGEHSISKNNEGKAPEKEELVEQSDKDVNESVPKRLSFEGICGKMNKEITNASPRQSARRCTSKYKVLSNANSKNEPKSSLKRKLEENPDDKYSNPCKKPALEADVAKGEPASHECTNDTSQAKRKGRPKKVNEDGLKPKAESSESRVAPMHTSPVTTRRKRKSLTNKVEPEVVNSENNKDQVQDKCESVVLELNSDNVELKNDFVVDDPTGKYEVSIKCSGDQEVTIILDKIEDQNTNATVVKEIPLDSSKCEDDNECVNFHDVSTPTIQIPESESKNCEFSSSEQSLKTPPSSETPNRRKKNKNPIKLNDFSPKMLRRGRTLIKTSPKVEKVKIKKAIDLPDMNTTNNDNLCGKEPAKEQEVNISIDSECKMVENNGSETEFDQIIENESTNDFNLSTKEIKLDLDSEVNSCQKSSLVAKQDQAKDGKVGPNNKTSPTRTMRMLQMVANGGLHNQTEAIQCSNKNDVAEDDSADTQNSTKLQKVVKYNSRASLIMQNAIDRNKTSDSTFKLDPKPIMIIDKNSIDNEKNVNDLNQNNENEESHVSVTSKRKLILKSPQSDKRMKIGKSGSLSDASVAIKGKKSGLDNWLIKKEKNFSQEVETVIIDKPDEIMEIKRDNNVIIDSNGTNYSNHFELGNINDNPADLDVVALPVTEDEKLVEVVESPPRWPKRWRKNNKPKDFIYSPLKRNRSPDNKTATRKAKQTKQMELSPSKPYSFVNWPKGDCETWVACEPTPETCTASPILKRKTAYPSPTKAQISPNVTPKKRVSFLDPPVTKGLLYSKDELGGEVQHAVLDKGTPVLSRRKKILLGIKSNEKEESNSIVSDNLETVKPDDANDVPETKENLPDTTAKSVETENTDFTATTSTVNDIIVSSPLTDNSCEKQKEISDIIPSTTHETEKSTLSTAMDSEQSENVNCESMDVDGGSTYAEDSENMNMDNNRDSMNTNEPLIFEESHIQEQEVDIVEKVVGKASEDTAACIVEPVENSFSIPEVSSDDSILNVDRDDISLIDDDIILPPCRDVKSNENDDVSQPLDDVATLPTDKLSELDDGTKEPETITKEPPAVESSENDISPINESDSMSVEENYVDKNSTLNNLEIKIENESSCNPEDVSVPEKLDIKSRSDENTPESNQETPVDISSNNSQSNLHNQIHEKCHEFNNFIERIDVKQVPKSSLQDILSVISTITSLAQKISSKP